MECATPPPGMKLNQYGQRPDRPLSNTQFQDAQQARKDIEDLDLELDDDSDLDSEMSDVDLENMSSNQNTENESSSFSFFN